EKANIVLDALDTLQTRQVVAKACMKLGIPFVHGAIAGLSGQITSILPGDKGLFNVYGPTGVENNYGLESITGSPAATPAVIAAWQVQEAIKILTGIGEPIHKRLLMLDFISGSIEELSFQ
ncbi:MAG: ThiF family adenylyltransferase, partial [Chloroflexi bacterium]|nr:ThiF family adenylyltransferase [Chloroflexota bacterium]